MIPKIHINLYLQGTFHVFSFILSHLNGRTDKEECYILLQL